MCEIAFISLKAWILGRLSDPRLPSKIRSVLSFLSFYLWLHSFGASTPTCMCAFVSVCLSIHACIIPACIGKWARNRRMLLRAGQKRDAPSTGAGVCYQFCFLGNNRPLAQSGTCHLRVVVATVPATASSFVDISSFGFRVNSLNEVFITRQETHLVLGAGPFDARSSDCSFSEVPCI